MSQQIQITGGAKVRNLEGVLTGASGVVSSLGINVPDGIPQLDGSGKILVSQLPNSVMEYKGTWNASTNTPTLANGTGNAGDVYVCSVAGTVNFGAGPIVFYVGDQVLYSGTIWQRASGSSGSVTSVAVTESGDSLTITGSPITSAGTINIGFAGNSGQYINGEGNLTTFPTIITQAQNLVTEVYNSTGATLSKGTVVYINGGQGNLPTIAKAIASGDSTSAQTYGVVRADISNNNNGYVTVIGSLNDLDTQAYAAGTQLYLSGTTAGAWTSTKPSAPIHLVYVGIVVRSHPTQGVVEVKIQNGYELDELHDVAISSVANNDGIFYNSSNDLWENKTIGEVLGYTPANDSLVVHLAGTETITGFKTFTNGIEIASDGGSNQNTSFRNTSSLHSGSAGLNVFGFNGSNNIYFGKGLTNGGVFLWTNSEVRYYTLPDANGTLALTSAIPANPVGGTGTTNTLPKFTAASTIGNSNITDSGSLITLGSNSYVNGKLGVGTTSLTNISLHIANNLTGSTTVNGIYQSGVIQSDATSNARIYSSQPSTAAASFTLANLSHFYVAAAGAGAGSTITNQYGFYTLDLTAATNNYGFFGGVSAGTNRWNLYMNGTANNYMAGSLGIGTTNLTDKLCILGNANISRSATTSQVYIGLGTSGSVTPSSLFWSFGLLANSNDFNIQSFNGTTLSTRLRIFANGNVGINTTTDSGYNLDVNGSIRSVVTTGRSITSTSNSTTLGTALLTNNGSTTYVNTLDMLAPNLTATQSVAFTLGTAASTNNTVGFNFYNAGAGSTSNAATFTFFGGSPLLWLRANGNMHLGTATDSGYKLDVNGTFRATGAATFSSSVTANYGGTFIIPSESPASGNVALTAKTSNGNNDIFRWYDGATQLGVFTNSGNVGIGTSSPGAPLGFADVTGLKIQFNANAANYYGIEKQAAVAGGDGLFKFESGKTSAGEFGFSTGGTNRMVITSGGNVLIGTTTDNGLGKLQVNGTIYSGNITPNEIYPNADNTYYCGNAVRRWAAVYAVNGTIQTSDRNLKTNIETCALGLDYVMKLNPVSYNWKTGDTKKHYGLIAQEVKQLEDSVGVNVSNEQYGLNYSELIAPLIKAIQEQQQMIDELKQIINNK